ncbi:MAG: 2-oxo acid dehydrogenase subunit E2 [Chloroflexi bacterium]|jgi:2-oxoglutarate dehydrogenase dihydrolipoamide succinyltransferase (E2 component)|nr:2-oxo acid dehydrogenase subunit E2 [Chloroflexota bacterium]
MPTDVIMPQLGESVVEGTITRWLKTVGERVEEFEPLLEVNTDKVDSEIPSPAAGVLLEILVPEGTTIQAGAVLARIGEAGEQPSGNGSPQGERQVETVEHAAEARLAEPVAAGEQRSAAPGPGRDSALGFISPVVARIAREQQVDLYQIQGTGRGGRITKKDILNYLEQREKAPASAPGVSAPSIPEPAAPPPTPPSPEPAPAPARPAAPAAIPGEILPLTAVRRAIAEHMVASKRTSPHVTTVMEVDMSRVAAHRKANKEAFARDGVNLTFTPYLIAAIVSALKAYPIVNSSWTDEGVRIHKEINIGMATSLGEDGLIVPVIRSADQLSLLGLARTVNDLANRARARQLKPDEVKGGTFTLTNHGVSGSLFATPIINQPQCAILGVGAIQKRVVVIEDEYGNDVLSIRPMAYVTLTFDHRILDGAIADYFLGKVVESLQNWA